jgi:hypothetical protein
MREEGEMKMGVGSLGIWKRDSRMIARMRKRMAYLMKDKEGL